MPPSLLQLIHPTGLLIAVHAIGQYNGLQDFTFVCPTEICAFNDRQEVQTLRVLRRRCRLPYFRSAQVYGRCGLPYFHVFKGTTTADKDVALPRAKHKTHSSMKLLQTNAAHPVGCQQLLNKPHTTVPCTRTETTC